ncbi:MAG: transglycosylase domain-containing protein [Defluviitaleaceae bacterium]|nr:transglycosylase domain-containing protein [Defluviitaleaceae bacterium]
MDYSQLGNKRRKRLQNPHATRMRNKISLLLLRVTLALVLIGGFAAVGAVMGAYLGILENSPELTFDGVLSPVYRSSVIVCHRTGEEIERLHGGQNYEFASIRQMPRHLIDAFVAIEDERFFEHNGVDPRGVMRAMYVIAFTDLPTQGASTITQQLVKNLLQIWDNNFITKLQEQYLAIGFERHLTEEFAALGMDELEAMGYESPRQAMKYYILQSYLNIINLGRAQQGVQAAAWFYYDVDVSELTIAQSATIAAITQNPSRFPPDIRPRDNWRRTQHVLENMHRLEFITDEEFEYAMREREHEHINPITGEHETFMLGLVYDTIVRMEGGGFRDIVSELDCFNDALVEQVIQRLVTDLGMTRAQASNLLHTGGLEIRSTQDLSRQAVVDRAFLNEELWPGVGVGFSIEVRYTMTLYNSITNQRRTYTLGPETVANLEAAEALVQNFHEQRKTAADTIESYRQFFLPQPQGAFVLIDHHTGHVLAMRGIRGEKQGNRAFNRATEALRSPGSQLKPLVPFGPLIDLGLMQPSTVVDDIPFYLPNPHGAGWNPTNHWTGFRGLSTVRNAIYASGNVVSARAAADTTLPVHAGLPAMVRFLEQLGVSTIHPHDGPAIVLGGMTNGMLLIELAGAYAAVANGGEFNEPILFTQVLDHEGNILFENQHDPQRVMRATTAYLLTHSMMDTLTLGTGPRANWSDAGLRNRIPIAGKTGTSERRRDLGFSGFTPYFTASIWMGNDNEQSLHSRANHYHTPLWRYIMEEIHIDLPARNFERPTGIVTATVCRDSGHLATDLCRSDPRGNRARLEVFNAPHMPSQHCTVHRQFTYCTESGCLASANCPYWAVVTRVGIVRPQSIDHVTTGVNDRNHEFPIGVRQGITCPIHSFGHFDNSWDGEWNFNQPGTPAWDPDMNAWVQQPPMNFTPQNPATEHSPNWYEPILQPTPSPPPTWGGLGNPATEEIPEQAGGSWVHTVPVPGID